MNVVQFPPSLRVNPIDAMTAEHRAFCLARQAMHRRLLEWLRAGGDLASIEEETGPIAAVLQQLIELERGR